jgi:hypothetical protein
VKLCNWEGCRRERLPVSPGGSVHSMCSVHERRVVAEAFGAVSWQDRAITNTLPPMIVGGVARN